MEHQDVKIPASLFGHIEEDISPRFKENLQSEYHDDPFIKTEDLRAYAGIPLIDSSGNMIGVLALMSRTAFSNLLLIDTMLSIFSAKASAELEKDYHIKALKTSEEKFRSLAENSPDIIYIINLRQRKIVYFNRTIIFGYHYKELEASQAWVNIVHPEDVSMVTNHWKRFLKSGGNNAASIEYRIKTTTGQYEWVVNRHAVIEHDESGWPTTILLNLTVNTKRKKAEEALRENQARLEGLIENTKDLIWSVDKQLNLTTLNSSFRDFVRANFSKEVEINDKLDSIFPQDIYAELKYLHEKAFDGERISIENSIFPDKYSYEISFNPIYSEKKEITGVSVFARDITARKMAEDNIIRTNFELDSFVYRASHDLRAPLRSVLGLINLVKTESDEVQRNHYLGLVDKSINKLDNFISDLTDFSRNSRLEINVEMISFESVLSDCIENLKYMDNTDTISIISDFNTARPFYSDSKRISIIFHNLLSNAIKYQNLRRTDSVVKVKVEVDDKEARITFADNGKGIKEEYLQKIFNMFFRASQDSYGSGLGLYITRQVIEKLNGNISVKSSFGEGTSFYISLPNLAETI
jgi:PAS domain S-box-containing protein